MKIMFISDIHGIKTNLDLIRRKMNEFQCEKLVVLGDLYYTGPKNKWSKDYDVSYVKEFLDSYKEQLICLRGNCDSEVDIEYSDFPIINDLSLITTNHLDIYLTHGHLYNENNWNKNQSILIFGHYHIPFIKQIGDNLYINPGSISLPKEDYKPSYLVWDEEKFTIYDVEDHIIEQKIMTA